MWAMMQKFRISSGGVNVRSANDLTHGSFGSAEFHRPTLDEVVPPRGDSRAVATYAPPGRARPVAEPVLDSASGWVTVAAAFVSMAVVFGVAYSFGAFFAPMAAEFGTGSGATSLVFSITACCWFLLGSVSGRAVDRFGPRPVLLVGAASRSPPGCW